jgi:hypothetical protein
MKKITALDLYPDNGVFRIFDASLDQVYTFHDVTKQTLAQGFSRSPGSYNFYVLADCMNLTIEVWLTDQQEEIQIKPDSIRAILVPFSVPAAGIMIGDLQIQVEQQIAIPQGEYALLFELKVRNDPEYLNSERYQQYVEGSFTEESCCLTFYPRKEPVQPEILRVDTWLSPPPYALQGYCPLKSTYPLLMEDMRMY